MRGSIFGRVWGLVCLAALASGGLPRARAQDSAYYDSFGQPNWWKVPIESVDLNGVLRGIDADNDAGRLAMGEVILQFLETLSGVSRNEPSNMPGGVATLVALYKRQVAAVPAALKPRFQAYVDSGAFRSQVYGQLMHPHWNAAWWATPQGRKFQQEEARATEAVRAADPVRSRKTVFTIEIDAPAPRLRTCGLLEAETTNSTCLVPAVMRDWDRIQRITGKKDAPAGMKRFLVLLQKDRCPDWTPQCELVLTARNGVVVSVETSTSDFRDAKLISQELVAKFGEGHKPSEVRCSFNDQPASATRLDWDLADLSVTYSPFAINACGVGSISVRSKVYVNEAKKAAARRPTI